MKPQFLSNNKKGTLTLYFVIVIFRSYCKIIKIHGPELTYKNLKVFS